MVFIYSTFTNNRRQRMKQPVSNDFFNFLSVGLLAVRFPSQRRTAIKHQAISLLYIQGTCVSLSKQTFDERFNAFARDGVLEDYRLNTCDEYTSLK